MGKSINKFIVRMTDPSEFKPKLVVSVKANKEVKKMFEVRLMHPNSKEVVYSEPFEASTKDEKAGFLEALAYGKVMLDKPEVVAIQSTVEYKEQIFIAQGRRGKMKLKTQEDYQKEQQAQSSLDPVAEIPDLDVTEDLDDSILETESEDVAEETEQKPAKTNKHVKPKKEKAAKVVKDKKLKKVKEVKKKVVKNKKKVEKTKLPLKKKTVKKTKIKNKKSKK